MRRSLKPNSPVERYFGAEEQVRILQEKLELTEYEHAVIVAAAIRVCVWQSMKQARARKAISDIKDARRSVAQIETTAKKLARLLESSPLGHALVHKPGSIFDENYGVRDEEGTLCLSETYEAEGATLQDFINTARVISSVAAKLLKDEVSFRSFHDLPPSRGAGKSAVAFCLWPQYSRFGQDGQASRLGRQRTERFTGLCLSSIKPATYPRSQPALSEMQ